MICWLIHDLSCRQLALEWTSIDEHWASSCADADGTFAVDCLTAGGSAAGDAGINAASPFACLRCRNAGGFFTKASAFLVFGFVGVAGGSGMGPRMELPTYLPAHPL